MFVCAALFDSHLLHHLPSASPLLLLHGHPLPAQPLSSHPFAFAICFPVLALAVAFAFNVASTDSAPSVQACGAAASAAAGSFIHIFCDSHAGKANKG